MKSLLITLLLLFSAGSLAAANEFSPTSIENFQLTDSQTPLAIQNYSYGYFKLGSSLVSPAVGLGGRFRSFGSTRGNDLSISLQTPLLQVVCFSERYTRLFYKTPDQFSSYFGLAFEAIIPVNFDSKFLVVPNVALIWGKERNKIRHSQLELNLLPIAALATAFPGVFQHRNDMLDVIAIMLAGACVTYTVAF
ncbi:MAG: hypothetical protein K9M07_04640 [Simkaniaceae bacterium]|nr:hypothetical protein [Simkaniaceae bacterium]